jgi:glycosyltransferase involved in cell wall biosynthesis
MSRKATIRVLILTPYPPGEAPNQRFRFEQYLSYLKENGIETDYKPFWSKAVWDIFYQRGHFLRKSAGLFGGILRRFLLLLRLKKYDFVWIHRETLPVGPAILEFFIARVFRKKIIYDFDDAIWIENYSSANKGVASMLKSYKKVGAICRYSYKIAGGNAFLADYARKYNPAAEVIPTTIDTRQHHNKIKKAEKKEKPVIGWTGTHSTLVQLASIAPQLEALQATHDFELRIICNEDPLFKRLKYKYIEWRKASEIEDLLKFDIGIMPLRNTDWERGKCGFKALQYMALGIPVVASAVGVNQEIISDGENGYLIPPDNPEEWKTRLLRLLQDEQLRATTGSTGRQTVIDHYSVESNKEKYLRLFAG